MVAERTELKRMNFYVNPEDLDRVARELGCRPSEVVRRLIDKYLLAAEIDEVRRMPGSAPEQVFRKGPHYQLPDIPDGEVGDCECEGRPSSRLLRGIRVPSFRRGGASPLFPSRQNQVSGYVTVPRDWCRRSSSLMMPAQSPCIGVNIGTAGARSVTREASSCYNTCKKTSGIVAAMRDSGRQTDLGGLERFALSQGGYFDRRDAQNHGITDPLLRYHRRTGRFEHVLPGVYRLTVAPISLYDENILAWVWTNYRGAISHESALALYALADVLPTRVHVTVPRPFHRTSAPFQVHLAPLPEDEVQMYNGVRATTPARAIVDAAASGTDPNQIHKAVAEALARGLFSPNVLLAAVRRRPNQHVLSVRRLIEEALSSAAQGAR